MREGSGLYETIGNDVEGSDAGPKAPEAGNPGPLRRAAALVGHYPRGGGRPVSGGNGASAAPGCPAGERPSVHRLFDLWSVHDGVVHRQYPLPLCQHIGGWAAGPAEIRPLLDLSAHRRELYAGVHGGPAAVRRPGPAGGSVGRGRGGHGAHRGQAGDPPLAHQRHLSAHGVAGHLRHRPPVSGPARGGLCMAAGRRAAVYRGGRAVRRQVAGAVLLLYFYSSRWNRERGSTSASSISTGEMPPAGSGAGVQTARSIRSGPVGRETSASTPPPPRSPSRSVP